MSSQDCGSCDAGAQGHARPTTLVTCLCYITFVLCNYTEESSIGITGVERKADNKGAECYIPPGCRR